MYIMPVIPQNPDDMTDRWCVDQISVVRDLRQERVMSFPRFVRGLNRSGFLISLTEYKKAEQYPMYSVPFIRAGLLTHAYKVLNGTRTTAANQTPTTARAMTLLSEARISADLGYEELAESLDDRGIMITANEYRAAEQGMTKVVGYDVVVTAADILGVEL